MASARHGQVKAHVDATPDAVWSVLANLERMGEWSPECYRVEWLDGATSPAKPGSRFKGWNRYGRMKWTTTSQVKAAEPGRELSWATVERGRDVVRWTYRLEPADGGTDVTESFDVEWLPLLPRLIEDYAMRDRDRRREQAMRDTLARIKRAAEAG